MWTTLTINAPTANAAALGNALTLITVDPWTHGVASGQGANTQLSFPNAVDAVIERLTGVSGAVLAIAVAASSAAALADDLSALATAFPLPTLDRLARRALKMVDLELTKLNLVPHMPQLGGLSIDALPPIRQLKRADLIKAAFDAAETFKSTSANSNLTTFAGERAAHAAMVSTIQAEAASGLTGGVGWRFYAASNAASALKNGMPGHDKSMTAMLLFAGPAADLTILTQIFPPPP